MDEISNESAKKKASEILAKHGESIFGQCGSIYYLLRNKILDIMHEALRAGAAGNTGTYHRAVSGKEAFKPMPAIPPKAANLLIKLLKPTNERKLWGMSHAFPVLHPKNEEIIVNAIAEAYKLGNKHFGAFDGRGHLP